MSGSEINLKAVLAEAFECGEEDITEDAEINDTLGWDSMSHISMVLSFDRFGISVEIFEIPELTTYAAVKQLFEANGFNVVSGTA